MLKKSQVKFIIYFFTTFFVIFILLYSLGLVPNVIKVNEGDSLRVLWDKAQNNLINKQTNQAVIQGENPTRIVISKIGVDATVSNPNTTDVNTLDGYLVQGAVRYPGSGSLGFGNMLIFGHSTGLTVVRNQAYKTFNGLKDLSVGDLIQVYGTNRLYTYKVTAVTLVDENKALVEFGNSKNMLTLSTCNTFGAKSERYVVEASYVQ